MVRGTYLFAGGVGVMSFLDNCWRYSVFQGVKGAFFLDFGFQGFLCLFCFHSVGVVAGAVCRFFVFC